MIRQPEVVLRLGSHAEKEYFEKLAKHLDGIMFGANLLEITPAATCSLIYSLRRRRGGQPLPFYLDPMTYCFGPYVDQSTGRRKTDLEALKSERKESRTSRKRIRAVKESYASLAENLGSPFKRAVSDRQNCEAINLDALSRSQRAGLCSEVIDYQLRRIREILAEDELLHDEFGDDALPAAVFAPYFFIHERWAEQGIDDAVELIRLSVDGDHPVPVHAIVCANSALLGDDDLMRRLTESLLKTGAHAAWLWFDGFDELEADKTTLAAFRKLVIDLGANLDVFNLHGGYFSLLLAHDGIRGISHLPMSPSDMGCRKIRWPLGSGPVNSEP